MDPLTQILTQRAMAPPTGPPQAQAPSMPPTGGPPKIPQAAKRFDNAQQIQDAYRGGWQPNPVLLRALLGHR